MPCGGPSPDCAAFGAVCSFIDTMSIKVIFGLGNTGAEYACTRHNAGQIALGVLADSFGATFSENKFCNARVAKIGLGGSGVWLVFCNGYMNNSGEGAKKASAFFGVGGGEIAVIYDDITLPVGRMKLTKGGSSGGHNGVADIMERLGNDFVRIRMGIGAKPFKQMDLADFVLGRLPEADLAAIRAADIKKCVETLVLGGLERAQNEFHRIEHPKNAKPKAQEGATDSAAESPTVGENAGGCRKGLQSAQSVE